eukprot:CAMPEP_0114989620 /NCGR_PEP_ID=MMETSP0216-20121206/10302_1 /TAXON_ID=223996 /ORGANISM="Protocruzia adherens, Strain Boccale" /LENGTH=919 /DNA_ID=CAMNT_0002352625 /DNA_START=11 /DNA_END=2770 /DNA_ORIENTATION=-
MSPQREPQVRWFQNPIHNQRLYLFFSLFTFALITTFLTFLKVHERQDPLENHGGRQSSYWEQFQYPVYKATKLGTVNNWETTYNVNLVGLANNAYGKNEGKLVMSAITETEGRFHLRIGADGDQYDSTRDNPSLSSEFKNPTYTREDGKVRYGYEIEELPFKVNVKRIPNGEEELEEDPFFVLSEHPSNGFYYTKEFIQFSVPLGQNERVYGLNNLEIDRNVDSDVVFWNTATESGEKFTHPFYMAIDQATGKSYGVLLHNSNAIHVIVEKTGYITYRLLGGLINLYIFPGPTPREVIQDYHMLIGRSHMPNYWSYGMHYTMDNWGSTQKIQEEFDSLYDEKIGIDGIWVTDEYTKDSAMFSLNESFADMKALSSHLHNKETYLYLGMEPVVATNLQNPSDLYKQAEDSRVFMKKSSHSIFNAHSDSGFSSYIDNVHLNATTFWEVQINQFHQISGFDGLVIKNSGPKASCSAPDSQENQSDTKCLSGKIPNKNHLPYIPDAYLQLVQDSFPLSMKHYGKSTSTIKNFNNIETAIVVSHISTSLSTPGVANNTHRPMIFADGYYVGGGHNSFYYDPETSGNIETNIRKSLMHHLAGHSLAPVVACRSSGEMTVKDCFKALRATVGMDTMIYGTTTKTSRFLTELTADEKEALKRIINLRYSILVYIYSVQFSASVDQLTTPWLPVEVEWPTAKITSSSRFTQYLVDSTLMFAPILEENSFRTVTLPGLSDNSERWFDFHTGKEMISADGSDDIIATEAEQETPIYLRGGRCVTSQTVTTEHSALAMRKANLQIHCGLDSNSLAKGSIIFDSGRYVHSVSSKLYLQTGYEITQTHNGFEITLQVETDKYSFQHGEYSAFDGFKFSGILGKPLEVGERNGQKKAPFSPTCFTYDEAKKILTIHCDQANTTLGKKRTIYWEQ